MKRFPYWSNERLASQQALFSGSSGPVAMTRRIGQVDPPSKLTASNNPAVRGAIFVSITMLRGSVGLTATVSSDSLPGRWLTLTFIGVAAARAFTEPPVPAEPTPTRAIPRADTQTSPTVPGRIASSLLYRLLPTIPPYHLCARCSNGASDVRVAITPHEREAANRLA